MDKEITVEELMEKLKEREKMLLNLPLHKRLLLVCRNFYFNWELHKFYKPFWFISEIKTAIKIIFKRSTL